MSLVSVSTLKEYLPEIQGSSIDADLTSLIARVEGFIARYLGFPLSDSATSYTLDQSTYTIYADGSMYGLEYVLQSVHHASHHKSPPGQSSILHGIKMK